MRMRYRSVAVRAAGRPGLHRRGRVRGRAGPVRRRHVPQHGGQLRVRVRGRLQREAGRGPRLLRRRRVRARHLRLPPRRRLHQPTRQSIYTFLSPNCIHTSIAGV